MSIMQILEESVRQMNKCAVIVTHSNVNRKKGGYRISFEKRRASNDEEYKENQKNKRVK